MQGEEAGKLSMMDMPGGPVWRRPGNLGRPVEGRASEQEEEEAERKVQHWQRLQKL